MATLTKAQQKLLADLGISSTDVEKAQARQAREAKGNAVAQVFATHEANLQAFLDDLVAVAPIEPSSKEGSSWVGTSGAGSVGGLGFKVVVTDKAASDARKAATQA